MPTESRTKCLHSTLLPSISCWGRPWPTPPEGALATPSIDAALLTGGRVSLVLPVSLSQWVSPIVQADTDTPLHHNTGLLPLVTCPGKDTPLHHTGGGLLPLVLAPGKDTPLHHHHGLLPLGMGPERGTALQHIKGLVLDEGSGEGQGSASQLGLLSLAICHPFLQFNLLNTCVGLSSHLESRK